MSLTCFPFLFVHVFVIVARVATARTFGLFEPSFLGLDIPHLVPETSVYSVIFRMPTVVPIICGLPVAGLVIDDSLAIWRVVWEVGDCQTHFFVSLHSSFLGHDLATKGENLCKIGEHVKHQTIFAVPFQKFELACVNPSCEHSELLSGEINVEELLVSLSEPTIQSGAIVFGEVAQKLLVDVLY